MVARLPGWGLPRRGSGRVSRRGQRMGAWAFLVCRPVDGLERIDPSGALQDQRPNSIDPNDLHLAERAYCSHRYYRLVGVAYLSAPAGSAAKTAETLGITLAAPAPLVENRRVPGEWLEYSSLLTVIICSIGFTCLGKVILAKGPIAALDLNTYNFFLMLGLLLHWTPRAFIRSVKAAVPATAGVLIQFPFYAGIFGMITRSSISHEMAQFFVRISTPGTYPVLIAVYSAVLGLFVPSAGSKWLIEAPYLLQAATQLHVNLGWVVQIYNTA